MQLVQRLVRRFNDGDIAGLASLYTSDAVNHQVVMEPLNGREAIRQMFEIEFGRASMTCIVENVFEDGEWAILEWRDPTGLRGRSEEHTSELQSLMRTSYHVFCYKHTRN